MVVTILAPPTPSAKGGWGAIDFKNILMYRLLVFLLSFSSFSVLAQTTTLKDGTIFNIIKPNDKGQMAAPGEYFSFHATMLSQADSILFSTRDGGEPQVVQLDTLNANPVPAVAALKLMRVGEVGRITVPMEMFPRKPPGLESDSILYYEVALLSVISQAEYEAQRLEEERLAAEAAVALKAREAEVLAFHQDVLTRYRSDEMGPVDTTASGLRYIIHERGEGEVPTKGESIKANYIGSLAEGADEPFDQSFGRGTPLSVTVGVGQVIPGWDEGLMLLPRGSKATFFIPAELGYGDRGAGGAIPGGAELVFYVELLDK